MTVFDWASECPEYASASPLYDRGCDVPGWERPVPASDPATEVYRLDAKVKSLFAGADR